MVWNWEAVSPPRDEVECEEQEMSGTERVWRGCEEYRDRLCWDRESVERAHRVNTRRVAFACLLFDLMLVGLGFGLVYWCWVNL